MMTAREEIEDVRVVAVTKNGKEAAFSSLCDKLERLSPDGFVAIDSEFSGLGEHPGVRDDNLQTRYSALRSLANSRAIFSVGVSIFNPVENAEKPTYESATYDLLTSCQNPFEMAPSAGEFLVAHAFDFNRMFKSGIPYTRASTEVLDEKEKESSVATGKAQWQWGKLPRGLLWRIGRHGVPLIVHNGLLDLVFLYAAFQAPLPTTLTDFIGSLNDCVPGGFWDSKVLATGSGERASFLSYLFAKSVLQDTVSVRNVTGLPRSTSTDPADVLLAKSPDVLCALYAFRGFCPRGLVCPFAHDPFKVVEEEMAGRSAKDSKEAHKRHKVQSHHWKRQMNESKAEVSKMSKKQRKKRELEMALSSSVGNANDTVSDTVNATSAMGIPPQPPVADNDPMDMEEPISNSETSNKTVHTAGWDAFCTAYIFASFRANMPAEQLNKERNYIALPSKLSNLLLRKSEYAYLDEQVSDREKNGSVER